MTRICIVCQGQADRYCKNDDAYLCKPCDEVIHSANAIAARHTRVRICELCVASPAEVYCANDKAYFCGACDEASHSSVVTRAHERKPVDEADASHGCSGGCNGADPAVREESGDSLFAVPMVPPGVEDLPYWHDVSGPLDARALLGKDFGSNDLDIFDTDPSWLERLDMGFDSLTQNILDGVVPEYDNNKDISGKDTFPGLSQTLPSSVSGEPERSLLQLDSAQVCKQEPLMEDFLDPTMQFDFACSPFVSEQPTHVPEQQVQFVPERPAYRHDVTMQDIGSFVPPSLRPVDAQTLHERSLDRKMRLARYREKKKNRQFKKTIRYASRKAYAEVRPRVKGRFARKDEVAAMRAAGLLPCA